MRRKLAVVWQTRVWRLIWLYRTAIHLICDVLHQMCRILLIATRALCWFAEDFSRWLGRTLEGIAYAVADLPSICACVLIDWPLAAAQHLLRLSQPDGAPCVQPSRAEERSLPLVLEYKLPLCREDSTHSLAVSSLTSQEALFAVRADEHSQARRFIEEAAAIFQCQMAAHKITHLNRTIVLLRQELRTQQLVLQQSGHRGESTRPRACPEDPTSDDGGAPGLPAPDPILPPLEASIYCAMGLSTRSRVVKALYVRNVADASRTTAVDPLSGTLKVGIPTSSQPYKLSFDFIIQDDVHKQLSTLASGLALTALRRTSCMVMADGDLGSGKTYLLFSRPLCLAKLLTTTIYTLTNPAGAGTGEFSLSCAVAEVVGDHAVDLLHEWKKFSHGRPAGLLSNLESANYVPIARANDYGNECLSAQFKHAFARASKRLQSGRDGSSGGHTICILKLLRFGRPYSTVCFVDIAQEENQGIPLAQPGLSMEAAVFPSVNAANALDRVPVSTVSTRTELLETLAVLDRGCVPQSHQLKSAKVCTLPAIVTLPFLPVAKPSTDRADTQGVLDQ